METGIFYIIGMLLNWGFGLSDWFSLNQNNLNEGQCAVEEFGTPFPALFVWRLECVAFKEGHKYSMFLA